MEINNLQIWSVTPKSSPEETILEKNKLWWINDKYNFILNNTEGLPKIYNKILDDLVKTDCDGLILIHDDAWFEMPPLNVLMRLFDDYDVVGVAGASKIQIKSPALWHLMGEQGHLHGEVYHWFEGQNRKFPTKFGTYPHRGVLIDGVCMAFNRKAMETVRFDETNPCKFHFYDLQMSLDAHLKGLRVGIGDLVITHTSPGLSGITKDWLNGEQWFLNKYGA